MVRWSDPQALPFPQGYYYIAVLLVIFPSALGCWWGSNISRTVLLVFLTVVHAYYVLFFLVIVAGAPRPVANVILYVAEGFIFVSSMVLVLNYWYFRAPHVREFYGLRG